MKSKTVTSGVVYSLQLVEVSVTRTRGDAEGLWELLLSGRRQVGTFVFVFSWDFGIFVGKVILWRDNVAQYWLALSYFFIVKRCHMILKSCDLSPEMPFSTVDKHRKFVRIED